MKSSPLTTLRDLSDELTLTQQPYKDGPYRHDLNVKLIGPAGSGTLRALVRESQDLKQKLLPLPDNIEVYSPSATISDCDLLNQKGSPPKWNCFKNPPSLLEEATLPIVRTTGTDDVLAVSPLWELWQRGVNRDPGYLGSQWKKWVGQDDKCEDGLVLIGERDTRYGRTLLQYLTEGFTDRCGIDKQVRTFSYLRGLDGVLADSDKSGSKTPAKDESSKSKDLREQLEDAPPEHAEGRNQFDYLRRLADEIDRLDDDKKSFAKNGVRAIGLVGSDIYDKLLILQALRSRFKDKIFFTTDLDARYLHADQKEWARNLVVASNFGLSLKQELQPHTLPFRDSYQTARYLATLMALDDKPIDHWTGKMKEWVRPQIFEIGRTEAIHLASPSVERLKNWIGNNYTEDRVLPAKKTACDGGWETCNNIEPIWPSRGLSLDHPWAISFMICIWLLLLTLANRRVNETVRAAFDACSPEQNRALVILFVVIGVVAELFTVLPTVLDFINDSLAQGVGEPFVWLEGVSVWPSLVIRFVGVLTMLALWCVLQNSLRSQQTRISKDFEIALQAPGKLNRRWWSAVFTGPHLNLASIDKDGNAVKKESAEEKIEVITLWQNYLRATSWREMAGWIVVSLLIGSVLAFLAFKVLGSPSFSHRGELVLELHTLMVIFNVLVLWLVTFWASYETRACARFIETLSDEPNKWPDQLLDGTAKNRRTSRAS